MGKAYRDPRNAYSLVIPDEWEYSVQSQSVAFYDPSGVGAMNVSTMRPPKGVIPKPEAVLLNFVSKSALEAGLVNVIALPSSSPSTRIAYAEYSEGNHAWRYWVFATDDLIVALTYNCRLVSQEIEDATVDDIIASIRLAA